MQTICEYLIERLNDYGVTEFLGVPGDFNFEILTAVEDNQNTNWIGCCNELNAAYASEGYARIKGLSACITTYGVGELSAINGIAGAYAQNASVVKIVGMPKTQILYEGIDIHHSLGNGRWDMYFEAFKQVTEYAVILSPENAFQEIEKALHITLKEKKPVYIGIPQDVSVGMIKKGDFCPEIETFDNKKAAEVIIKKLKSASRPILMLDSMIYIHKIQKEVTDLINKLEIPFITTTMGKGSVNEDNPYFGGVFIGNILNKPTEKLYVDSDYILTFGLVWTDFNIGHFTLPEYNDKMIKIEKHMVKINDEKYRITSVKELVKELIKQAVSLKYDFEKPKPYQFKDYTPDTKLKCENLAPIMQNFFKEDDLIVSETGISDMGIVSCSLPPNTRLLTQTLYSSIGWAAPASFGAGLADKSRRLILITGDGSLMQTVQDVSSFCRYGVNPIIILINNDGYTIERILSKDPYDPYNEIAKWDWSKLSELFCRRMKHFKAETTGELEDALKNSQTRDKPYFIEVKLDKMDMPPIAKILRERYEKNLNL